MKILVAGDFHSEIHEPAFCRAFREAGHEVIEFGWFSYFKGYQLHRSKKIKKNFVASVFYRFQNKYSIGPLIRRINRDFLAHCKKHNPDLILIFRGIPIRPDTLKKIKNDLKKARLFAYNNDDPFGHTHPPYFWRNFLKSLPLFDHVFAYREKNIDDYAKIGITRVSILRSYYIKERNYPIENMPTREYVADVGFIGHFENDGRDEYCKALATHHGVSFRLNGYGWQKSKHFRLLKTRAGPILPLYQNNEYNKAVNSVKIALVFLSTLNNDTYTRRCFEIPAARIFMLAQYSTELASLFTEGVEAEYFRSIKEMLEKTDYYLRNDAARNKIAKNGYERLMRDGHEMGDRAEQIIAMYTGIGSGLKQ